MRRGNPRGYAHGYPRGSATAPALRGLATTLTSAAPVIGPVVGLVTALLAATVLMSGSVAVAQWLQTGTATARADAARIPKVGSPSVATAVGDRATIIWNPVKVTPSRQVSGYVVRRYAADGTTTVACTADSPAVSCADPQPVVGTVSYTVAATFASWSGVESSPVTYDGIAPSTTLSTSAPANPRGWWTASPVAVTLNAADGGSAGSGVASITYRVGAAAPVTINAASTSFAVAAQGSTTLTYFATDKVGNAETPKTYTLQIDSVTPAAPTGLNLTPDTGASTADRITNSPRPQILGSAEPGATVEITVDGTPRWSVTATANGTFSAGGGPADTLTDGPHLVSARAVDRAGNTSPPTSMNITIDTTAPTTTVTSPTQNATITAGTWSAGCSQPAACGTANDPGAGASGVQRLEYELRHENGVNSTCWNGSGFNAASCSPAMMTAAGTTTWNVAVPYSSMPTGTYRLRIYAIDLAGNIGAQTQRRFDK